MLQKLTHKINQSYIRRISVVFVLLVFFTAIISGLGFDASAQTARELQNQATELQSAITDANERASKLDEKARDLEEALEQLDKQIEESQKKIASTGEKIAVLQGDLDKAQAELDRHKGLLRSNMRALYKRGDVSDFELLASSESFSEFIDEQEYLERLKLSIQESTSKVLELRLSIQAQQDEQKELLRQQQTVKRSLDEARQEREQLLDNTRNEETRLREYSQNLGERQREINRELLRLSRVVNVSGAGGYPWANTLCLYTDSVQGPCRHPENSVGDYEWYVSGNTNDRKDPWGYFYRNCTSYVAWKSATMGFELDLDGPNRRSLGDGGAWGANASKYRELSTGDTPKVGSFAVFNIGGFGHVAYVEKVVGNEILVSEYNFVADGVYSERWISRYQPNEYVYTPFSQ
ncbi:cell wall hydrolase P40 [soil metagenome]